MKFSEDRIYHISHLILDEISKSCTIDNPDRAGVLNEIKKVILEYFKAEDLADDLVRQRIRSYSRNIVEGSREWGIMYDKLLEEELKKIGFKT